MRKETKKQAEKSNIFDEVKREKSNALKTLQKAKMQESEKLNSGYVYVTSADGKSKILRK